MSITANQVDDILARRLRESGVSKVLSKEHSQFLDLGEELFVEIVLTDATRLEDAEKIVRDTAQELKAQNIRLDTVIRALWEVVDVSYVGPSRSADGGLRAASEFQVILQSGGRKQSVVVDLSWVL
jgi:hypothetical protein